jgi:nicotinamidase-related amidase
VPLTDAALVVIDVQRGFDDPSWGPRNNPDCEHNVVALLDQWRTAGRPVVLVRHDSAVAGSPLGVGSDGNAFKPGVDGTADLLVTKQVHSAFYGAPDLHGWLSERGIRSVAVCGITTDHCCETTTRMAGDLGYETFFIADATHAFDRRLPDGTVVSADDIARATAASLHDEFATVVTTADALAAR